MKSRQSDGKDENHADAFLKAFYDLALTII